MRKKLLPFITIAIMLLFGACSNEELLPEVKAETNVEETRTLSLTATMPGEDKPATRVVLEQNDKDIELKWVVGDELELAFVQGTIKRKVITAVTNISADGKTAQFDIVIPSEITDGQFNLYGVYGGGGLSDDNFTDAILPSNARNAVTLSEVQARKDVMLYFASEGVDVATPQVSVEFKHLGSLFAVTIMNSTSENLDDATVIRLACNDENAQWAYNTDDGGQKYDLVSRDFQNKADGSGFYISFNATGVIFPVGETTTLWGWYPPLPDVNWPELQLQVFNTEEQWIFSENTKPARDENTKATAGKSYYFYAKMDGTGLNFTNDQFEVPEVPEEPETNE